MKQRSDGMVGGPGLEPPVTDQLLQTPLTDDDDSTQQCNYRLTTPDPPCGPFRDGRGQSKMTLKSVS